MAVAKEDETYVAFPSEGDGGWNIEGVFFRDTLYLERWAWQVSGARRLARTVNRNLVDEVHVITRDDHSQAVGLRRTMTVERSSFLDRWECHNSSAEERVVELKLAAVPRLIDLFATRVEPRVEAPVEDLRHGGDAREFSRVADDGVIHSFTMRCAQGLPDDLSWRLTLPPGATASVAVEGRLSSSDYSAQDLKPLPSYEEWRASFGTLGDRDRVVAQSIDDLRALLLSTEHGPYPAAGAPVFINFFGRDALIAGMMILDWRPDILRSVLAFLAARQGRVVDPFREEEPGKILHEVRRGELSRTGRIPFGRYYGSVDSTPLFLMACGAYFTHRQDTALAAEITPAIRAATTWLVEHLQGPSGLATFEASGSGLTVQSWKDSANSMVDEHGQAARQPLAVAEVQGYCFAALQAAAHLLPEQAIELEARAATLRDSFHRSFWLEDLGTYAMALDADMRPLRVLSSDPGHLLWCGVVPEAVAPILVRTLLGPDLWSGWGLRTLGANEVAYNPVSYHNGSVWPHDTGLFAMGLERYGFHDELAQVATALLDLAEASPRRQMPELVSGFGRDTHDGPVPYTHANAPQAWAAATVIRMAAYRAQARAQEGAAK